jgi:hypothetical protein
MANTAGPATFPSGAPQANPYYLVDVNGNPLSSTNPPSTNIAQIGGNVPAVLADGTANPTLVAIQAFPMVFDGTNWQRGPRAVNGLGDNNTLGGAVAVGGFLHNGTNWDKQRGNLDTITLINAANVSATQTSADQTNFNGRGVKVWLNITTFGAALTLAIQYKDPVSGQYITALSSVAISANTFTQYTIYPGITGAANVSLSDVLPRTWRTQVTGPSGSTFTVGASVIL